MLSSLSSNARRACAARCLLRAEPAKTMGLQPPRRLFAAQSSRRPSSGGPGQGTQTTASAEKRERHPTESEEDIAADRSRVDPLHRRRPTESEESVAADRLPEDPLHPPKADGRAR
ncbi:hypothetical protein RJ55_04301 [Drechmeria coniospora]|nr:hypothetical protein RJ55_04301 [Drechmeria coniospora]